MSLREEIREILNLEEYPRLRGTPRDYVIDAILAAIKKRLPEWKPAHTYASENADEYHAYDNGFKDCLKQVTKLLESPDAEGGKV